MRHVRTFNGLPDKMIRRILPRKVSNSELAAANIQTITLMPILEKAIYIVFGITDVQSKFNYVTELTAEEIFSRMQDRLVCKGG